MFLASFFSYFRLHPLFFLFFSSTQTLSVATVLWSSRQLLYHFIPLRYIVRKAPISSGSSQVFVSRLEQFFSRGASFLSNTCRFGFVIGSYEHCFSSYFGDFARVQSVSVGKVRQKPPGAPIDKPPSAEISFDFTTFFSRF